MEVVINKRYGGFSLSEEAMRWINERKPNDQQITSPYIIERNDPLLLECLRILGVEKVNGEYAKLEIIEIPDDVDWVIEEYDGTEWVAEQHRLWR